MIFLASFWRWKGMLFTMSMILVIIGLWTWTRCLVTEVMVTTIFISNWVVGTSNSRLRNGTCGNSWAGRVACGLGRHWVFFAVICTILLSKLNYYRGRFRISWADWIAICSWITRWLWTWFTWDSNSCQWWRRPFCCFVFWLVDVSRGRILWVSMNRRVSW